ncbi:hypothetical protein SK128_007477, partial [Halocaridina rubra]
NVDLISKWPHVIKGKTFASHEINGQVEYAKLSCTGDGKLCLHYFSERKLPPDTCIIQTEDLMNSIRTSSLAFLELGIGNSTLGRMYIRLLPGTAETEQFKGLCTGELGKCYLNTNILRVKSKGNIQEHVLFGDYENNDGSGGKALFPGAGMWTGDYKIPWQEGVLEGLQFDGYSKAAQFYINTRNNPGNVVNPSLGRVEEGLQILTRAIEQFANIMDIRIIDCGIVLSYVLDCNNGHTKE